MEICIIKLGALGDVVRTLPVVNAIRKRYAGAKITWITKPESLDIVKKSGLADKIEVVPCEGVGSFDTLYNFDVDASALKLAKQINASEKKGFYADGEYPVAFNPGAEYYLNTIFDDELKRQNNKTYQEMMFEVAEINDDDHLFEIRLTEKEKEYGVDFVQKNNLSGKIIGIHIGSSKRWPSKAWHRGRIVEFVALAEKNNYSVVLLGGPEEIKLMEEVKDEIIEKGLKICSNNLDNTIMEFMSLVYQCSAIVSADSLALHISLALKKPTIGLFFCTSPNEIEGYGLLEKVIAERLYEFFPDKMDKYDEELTRSISAEQVFEKLEEILSDKHNNNHK
ncbi:MAG: glycosyltransferase family 9 protein [archaeon]